MSKREKILRCLVLTKDSTELMSFLQSKYFSASFFVPSVRQSHQVTHFSAALSYQPHFQQTLQTLDGPFSVQICFSLAFQKCLSYDCSNVRYFKSLKLLKTLFKLKKVHLGIFFTFAFLAKQEYTFYAFRRNYIKLLLDHLLLSICTISFLFPK